MSEKTYTNEEFEELWQQANRIFENDPAEGFRAWLRLSKLGYARAAHSAAWCYRYGNGVEKDTERAKEYFRLAVEGGYDRSYASLLGLAQEEGKIEEVHEIALDGARRGSSECFCFLATECADGKIFGRNSRVAAYLAAKAYELDPKNGYLLGLYYLDGFYFPKVHSYAKYCIENSSFPKDELESCGMEFPEYWDKIEPVAPAYPDFGLTLEDCESATDPEKLLDRAEELMFADPPDTEAAKPLVLEAAKAGLSHAMYYTCLLDIKGWQEWLVKGADEYGDLDCTEYLALAFADGAVYKVGNPYLFQAMKYWNKRKKLHGQIPMEKGTKEGYERYQRGLDKMFGRVPKQPDPHANAVILRADGSYERIKADFESAEGLRNPLGCDRINIVSTVRLRELSDKLGFTVVMYCDERGMMKHLPENAIAANLSGYDVIWGDAVICGFQNDCAPLFKDEIEEVLGLLDAQ